MKIFICESRTQTLGTLSMTSIEVDFVNIYYDLFNNTAIIYIGILQDQYLIVHTLYIALYSWLITVLTVYVYSSIFILAKVSITHSFIHYSFNDKYFQLTQVFSFETGHFWPV